MFAFTEQKHLEIGFGKIIFLSNWGFHDDYSTLIIAGCTASGERCSCLSLFCLL